MQQQSFCRLAAGGNESGRFFAIRAPLNSHFPLSDSSSTEISTAYLNAEINLTHTLPYIMQAPNTLLRRGTRTKARRILTNYYTYTPKSGSEFCLITRGSLAR